ncbi:MAG TPA: ABC transporter ATP-binding protein [Candidatus Sulfomarinibacteraceae bacterium]|nr:ABC transporter ATP-binding protein [Candidatus Sulfomarinibacteraceae bacterium]
MLELQNITKRFDEEPVLRSVSLHIDAGEVVALLGPSGSGKTTLLRIIAGLETADEGQLFLRGRDLTEIPVHERPFGMVFQDYALFPHKSVAENVSFGLRMQSWPAQRIQERCRQVLTLVGLEAFGERPVYELSGGEQQRVALARALAPAPRLLLLDEPLGALDRALRERLMDELRRILNEVNALSQDEESITAIYVTHDQAEAFAVSDRVVVLRAGCIEQDAPPVELYRHPRTPFVARFIGMENLLEARLVSQDPLEVESDLGRLRVAIGPAGARLPQLPTLLVRPDAARVVREENNGENVIEATLEEVSFRGRYQQATVSTPAGAQLKLEFGADEQLPQPGAALALALDPRRLVLMPSDEEAGC